MEQICTGEGARSFIGLSPMSVDVTKSKGLESEGEREVWHRKRTFIERLEKINNVTVSETV